MELDDNDSLFEWIFFCSAKYCILFSMKSIVINDRFLNSIKFNFKLLFGEIFFNEEKNEFSNIKS